MCAVADDGVGAFEKDQRNFRCLEGQFLGVVSVIEAERENRADFKRWQPDEFTFCELAAVGKANPGAGFSDRVNGALIGDTSVFHGQTPDEASEKSRQPRPSARMRMRLPGAACGAR